MQHSRKIITVSEKIQNVSETAVQKNKNFHGSMKLVLFLAQCMGQMPVTGIAESNSSYLRFKWKSWRTIYCILNCVGGGLITSVCVYWLVKDGVNISQITNLAFHLGTFTATLFFLKLAIEWPRLMYQWSHVEFLMRNYGYPKHLHVRIKIITISVLTIAAIEYTMARTTNMYQTIVCKDKDDDLFEYYFTRKLYPEIFQLVSYALWKGILIQIENLLMTFVWTFHDVFLMVVSTALALRFRQVTEKIKLLKNNSKGDNENIWRQTREDYSRLSKLTRNIDDTLSYITFTSFASNLYFIIVQFFNSLRKMKDTLTKVYFFFSFGFLILRTISVTIYGAWIYDESKAPLTVLNSVSSDIYNIEIKRFSDQIKFDTVALTGKNFFYVTRGLLLSMAGVIVTYELVLIQFSEDMLHKSEEHTNNATVIC